MIRSFLLSALLLLCAPAALRAQLTIEDQLYAYVLGMEGRTNPERAEFIKAQLDKIGVGHVSAPFHKRIIKRGDTTIIDGENIIVRLGHGTKRLILAAHFDAAPQSPGANDNASGVAVLLGLIDRLQGLDLNMPIDVVFFDQYEKGMTGSSFYLQQFCIPARHLGLIDVTLVGNGDEVYVGPTGNSNYYLLPFLRSAAKLLNVPFTAKDQFPPSDYVNFVGSRLECIGLSIVPKGDAVRISAAIKASGKADSASSPRVIGVMRSPDDRSILLRPESLKLAYDFLRATIEALNEKQ